MVARSTAGGSASPLPPPPPPCRMAGIAAEPHIHQFKRVAFAGTGGWLSKHIMDFIVLGFLDSTASPKNTDHFPASYCAALFMAFQRSPFCPHNEHVGWARLSRRARGGSIISPAVRFFFFSFFFLVFNFLEVPAALPSSLISPSLLPFAVSRLKSRVHFRVGFIELV